MNLKMNLLANSAMWMLRGPRVAFNQGEAAGEAAPVVDAQATLYPEPAAEGEAPAGDPLVEAEKPEGEAPKEEPAAEEKPEDKPSEGELKLPEGVELDDSIVAGFKDLSAELGLQGEVPQKLLDYGVKLLQDQATAMQSEVVKAWETTIEGWKGELSKDPEFSGDREAGAREIVGKALEVYGTPETREAFDLTGAGWNPAIVKFVHNMAKALNEGTIVPPGRPPGGRPRSGVEALYGNE